MWNHTIQNIEKTDENQRKVHETNENQKWIQKKKESKLYTV